MLLVLLLTRHVKGPEIGEKRNHTSRKASFSPRVITNQSSEAYDISISRQILGNSRILIYIVHNFGKLQREVVQKLERWKLCRPEF